MKDIFPLLDAGKTNYGPYLAHMANAIPYVTSLQVVTMKDFNLLAITRSYANGSSIKSRAKEEEAHFVINLR